MAERAPMTDEELDRVAEMLLDKMVKRLARREAKGQNGVATRKDASLEPLPEDFAAIRARRLRRHGRG